RGTPTGMHARPWDGAATRAPCPCARSPPRPPARGGAPSWKEAQGEQRPGVGEHIRDARQRVYRLGESAPRIEGAARFARFQIHAEEGTAIEGNDDHSAHRNGLRGIAVLALLEPPQLHAGRAIEP